MSDELQTLEQKIDRLINICARLEKENHALREREASLLRERSRLMEKNELARTRVEHMIVRLKNLNNES